MSRRIIVIDGYNVTKNIPCLAELEAISLEKSRDALLQRCAAWKSACKDISEIIIYFDGRINVAPNVMFKFPGVNVFFTKNMTADEAILGFLEASPTSKRITIVSNDIQIKKASRRCKADVLSIQEFHKISEKNVNKPGSPRIRTPSEAQKASPEIAKIITQEFEKRWLGEDAKK